MHTEEDQQADQSRAVELEAVSVIAVPQAELRKIRLARRSGRTLAAPAA